MLSFHLFLGYCWLSVLLVFYVIFYQFILWYPTAWLSRRFPAQLLVVIITGEPGDAGEPGEPGMRGSRGRRGKKGLFRVVPSHHGMDPCTTWANAVSKTNVALRLCEVWWKLSSFSHMVLTSTLRSIKRGLDFSVT